jgi:type IV secretory pathway TraG/TraD family ATPase VirD4
MDSLIATTRSNKVATTLAMQDFSQLKKDYGRGQVMHRCKIKFA